jgi:tetrahydromethanopterin S-methyltransferase subunit B
MTDINYSEELRMLIDDYSDACLTRVDYLAKRRELLDAIDDDFNSALLPLASVFESRPSDEDITAIPPGN